MHALGQGVGRSHADLLCCACALAHFPQLDAVPFGWRLVPTMHALSRCSSARTVIQKIINGKCEWASQLHMCKNKNACPGPRHTLSYLAIASTAAAADPSHVTRTRTETGWPLVADLSLVIHALLPAVASFGQFPYVALLYFPLSPGSSQGYVCTGSLIRPNVVLTAGASPLPSCPPTASLPA